MSRMDFVPIPMRAIYDTDLSASDHRILGAIAQHDRRGANALGCFASPSTLAGIARCSLRSAERSISTLQERGHIRVERAKKDRRRYVLRVVYDLPLEKPAKSGGEMHQDPRQLAPKSPPTLNGVPEQHHGVEGSKQIYKQIPLSGEANPDESASLLRRDAARSERKSHEQSEQEAIGQYLRLVEDGMKAMHSDDRQSHIDSLFDLLDSRLQHGENLYHWAERLMAELAWLNDSEAYDEAHA